VKAYVVGGAVRDELLGRKGADRDWVVVGATPEQMTAAGYTPVGRDFPVFLHPATHEEYALARTERKNGRGYRGFTVLASPEVTLEEDLRRRDLTINAMARSEEGVLIDPYGGEADLRAGLMRHVSEAFAEDPVRILRVARFAARFGFRVAEETMALMRTMVAAGEVDYLVPERVWQEFAKGIEEVHPDRMLFVLEECAAMPRLMPPLDALLRGPARGDVLASLARAVGTGARLAERVALFGWHSRDPASWAALCDALRAPLEVRDLAVLAARSRDSLSAAGGADASELLKLLKLTDAFRRRDRLESLLGVARLADPGLEEAEAKTRVAMLAAASVDAGAVAKAAGSSAAIPAALDAARTAAIAAALD